MDLASSGFGGGGGWKPPRIETPGGDKERGMKVRQRLRWASIVQQTIRQELRSCNHSKTRGFIHGEGGDKCPCDPTPRAVFCLPMTRRCVNNGNASSQLQVHKSLTAVKPFPQNVFLECAHFRTTGSNSKCIKIKVGH